MILVTKWFGVFLCEDETVRKFQLFDKDPKSVAKKLAAIQKGEILPEERALAVRRMKVADVRLKKLGKPTVFDSSFIRPEAYGIEPGFMQKVMVELGKVRTREPLSEDKCIAQAIRAQDDIIETINLMNERMHEWYGLHFPEFPTTPVDQGYVELIAKYGERGQVLKALEVELESVELGAGGRGHRRHPFGGRRHLRSVPAQVRPGPLHLRGDAEEWPRT